MTKTSIGLPRIASALLVPLLAGGLQWLSWSTIRPYIWFLFYPAVFLSSWIGGKRGGLAATLLSAGLAIYVFEPPAWGWAGKPHRAWLSVVAFVGMGALFSTFHERLREANRLAAEALRSSREANDRLEDRVRERTVALDQAGATLRMSEERLGGIVNSAMDAIVSVDQQQRVVLFNAAAEKMFGCSATEALGHPLDRFIPARVRERHRQEIYDFGHTGMTSRSMQSLGTLSAVRADGTEFPVEASISQITVAGKKVFTAILRDITERQHAEEVLAESKALLQTVIDGSREPIYLKDRESRIVLANPAALKVAGKSADYVIGRHAGQLYSDPGTAESILATDRRIMESGVGETLEETIHTPTGDRVFLSTKTPNRDGTGRVVGLIGISVDITDRIRAERELRDREIRYRTTLDGMLEACQIIGIDWRYLYLNETAARYARTTREALLGRTIAECFPGIENTEIFAALRAGLAGRQTPRQEFAFDFPDGTRSWFELGIQPVPEGIFVISLDVTERKHARSALQESEARFRQIAENINEVFWIREPGSSGLLYVSPAFETIWGRTCTSLYDEPDTWFTSIHPEDRDCVEQAMRNKPEQGNYLETYRVVRPDGSVRWVRDRAFPLRNGTGRVYRVLGTAEDITEHRRLETQLRHAQKMEAIGTLAGGIAHDFNNILAAILGFADLIKMQGTADAQTLEYVDDISRAGQRATALVRQILTFSRQEKPERRPVQLNGIVEESMKLLRATIPASVEFKVNLPADAATVLAEPSQIHQVVMNLGTNAWHAMRDRPGRLEVSLGNFVVDAEYAATMPLLRPGSYVRLSVSDTGIGMDRATLERIFEPFFTTKAPGEGTGLGLSVVHGIMQNHDGAVTVYSRLGEGTIFHLFFPVLEHKALEANAESGPIPRGYGERILFVDDEEPIVRMGRTMLGALGYSVAGFTSVIDALSSVQRDSSEFDLVITDQNMPDMTGVEFARQLLALRPNLPIILTTGYSADLTPDKVKRLGLADLLLKPVVAAAFAVSVRRVLDVRRS